MTIGSSSFSTLVHSIAVSTQMATQASWVSVLLRSADGDWYVTAADTRPDAPFMRLRHNGQVPKWLETEQAVIRSNDPFLSEQNIPFDEWDTALFKKSGTRLAAPVLNGDSLIGLIAVGKGVAGSRYPVSHLNFLKSMADMAGVAISGHSSMSRSNPREDHGDLILRRMAHDLKGPLATILTYLDLVRQNKRSNLSGDQLERLNKAGRSGRRLLNLLNDFVDFARLRAGSMGLDRSEFSLSSVIEEVSDVMTPGMDTHGQALRRSVPKSNVTIWADKARIIQVVSTLVSNASRYSPDDTPIDLEAWSEGSILRMRIVDRGRGMTEEQIQMAFEPFDPNRPSRRSESDQQDAGSGLGLVLARGMVHLHGGQIRIQSRPGEGTVAEFDMPVVLTGEKHEAA